MNLTAHVEGGTDFGPDGIFTIADASDAGNLIAHSWATTEYNQDSTVKAKYDTFYYSTPPGPGNPTLEEAVTKYTYDSRGLTKTMENAYGHIYSFTYDDGGREKTIEDPLGRVTEYQYDNFGRLAHTIKHGDDYDIVTQARYDGRGRRIAEIDAMGLERHFDYDESGRLTEVKMPDPDVVGGDITGASQVVYSYEYDRYGNQIKQTTPKPDASRSIAETFFTYDHLNRPVKRIGPDGKFEKFVYYGHDPDDPTDTDTSGRLKYTFDFAGRVTGYTYDEWGQLEYRRHYDGPNASTDICVCQNHFRYDALGQLTNVDTTNTESLPDYPDVPDRSAVYEYDGKGRIETVQTHEGYISYEYQDATGRLSSRKVFHEFEGTFYSETRSAGSDRSSTTRRRTQWTTSATSTCTTRSAHDRAS